MNILVIFKTILALILFTALMFLLIPVKKLGIPIAKPSERLFMVSQILGIILGGIGILCLFISSADLMRSHLWKILLMPYAIFQLYMAKGFIVHGTDSFDEKQHTNLAFSAGLTLGFVLLLMGMIVDPLMVSGELPISLLSPILFIGAVFFYSFFALFLFRYA